MNKKEITDLEDSISDLLSKKQKDYITITQMRSGLSLHILKKFNLSRNSLISSVYKKRAPAEKKN